ncbi:MAG TPA: alpha/beta fold hydrolase [Rhizomicrobium sp.]|jgi:alpha-beta hydrolase superfamily lysophospholipase
MGTYRISLRRAVPWKQADAAKRHRWALAALDPKRAKLFVGSHPASDGAQVPYRFWPARSPRALLLLLHGCCDYAGAFDDIAPKLAKRGITCLAYDQRGFGATASHGLWTSQDRIAQDACEMVCFLRARAQSHLPLFILGESMGGSVAVHVAARHAELDIAGLVLVAPGALASAVRNKFYHWLMRGLGLVARQSEIIVERTDARELSATAALRLMSDPLVMQSIRPALLDGVIAMGYAAVEAAREISTPTLTLIAGKDDLLRTECVRQLHDNLQGPKFWARIESAPHLLLHWRRGDVVLGYVRRWIERRLAPSKSKSAASDAARVILSLSGRVKRVA